MDIAAEVAEAKLREVVQAEEWAMFHGDSTIANSTGATSFDGLDKQIVTNVIDMAGASLTFTGTSAKQIDRLVKLSRLQGGQPSHLFMSFGMQSQINQGVGPQARYIVENGTTVTAGIHASNYQSPMGMLAMVGDYFINPSIPYPYNTAGSSGSEGALASSIYLIQASELEMVDLMPVGRTELAKQNWSIKTLLYRWILTKCYNFYGNTEGTSIMPFKKNQVPWNKGKRLSALHCQNLSLSHRGQEAWNKDTKGATSHSAETRALMSERAKERGFGKATKGRKPWNKDTKGLYTWDAEQRAKWEAWSQTPDAQENFRRNAIKVRQQIDKRSTGIELALSAMLDNLGYTHQTQLNIDDVTIVDSYVPAYRLVLYADGDYWHNYPDGTERDATQMTYLAEHGYNVLRFWERDIEGNPSQVRQTIEDSVETIRKGYPIVARYSPILQETVSHEQK